MKTLKSSTTPSVEDIEKKQEIYNLLLMDSEYNISPGVGSKSCPFEINNYMEYEKIASDAIKSLICKIILYARICNSKDGQTKLKVQPGRVKSLIKELVFAIEKENAPKPKVKRRKKKVSIKHKKTPKKKKK